MSAFGTFASSLQQPGPTVNQVPDKNSEEWACWRKTNKNIIVCCDGTGNEFAGREAKNSNSNVVKFYTALKLDVDQIAYYHPGVGTMGDPTKSGVGRQWSRIKGLAFGYGFKENVLDAYRYLMQHYNSGDKVFLFGFSRGAYTARALAGLLHGYGLLCRGNEEHIAYAWRMYTQKMQDQGQMDRRTIEPDYSFCNTFSHKDYMTHFVGLWDTVSSVGWISQPLRLLHLAQNPTIKHGRHAISIDERRCFYQDNLWGSAIPLEFPPVLRKPDWQTAPPVMQDIVQVWFSGVHSDVGGSYPQLKSGLANITLKWMMDEAKPLGVHFDLMRQDVVLGNPVNDPQGLEEAILPLYEKPKSSPVNPSLRGPWWLLEAFPHRYYDSDDSKESKRIPMGAWRRIPKGALVDASVRQRIVDDICYRPRNVSLDEITMLSAPRKDGKSYFVFEPSTCRGGGWRENWFVVFCVSVLEIALGFKALQYMLAGLVWLAIWMVQVAGWLGTLVHPEVNRDRIATAYGTVRALAGHIFSAKAQWMLHWYWPLALATVVVVWWFILALARRLRG